MRLGIIYHTLNGVISNIEVKETWTNTRVFNNTGFDLFPVDFTSDGGENMLGLIDTKHKNVNSFLMKLPEPTRNEVIKFSNILLHSERNRKLEQLLLK
jgi:hypothetical protein